MDPQQHRSELRQPNEFGRSLLCIGGMLRVANPSHSELDTTPKASFSMETISCRTPNTTPFNSLASPFPRSPYLTALTTPCSPCLPTPTHQRLRTNPTRGSATQTNVARTPVVTPESSCFSHCKRSISLGDDSFTDSANNLLTPKQVRELRRLCRKTANRAEFDDRLIQIRQIASISAMASSTIHLFDPGNPSSGESLRSWVEAHRKKGAEWRDECHLWDSVIDELRRWDRLLKAWAHHRSERRIVSDAVSQPQTPTVITDHNVAETGSGLKPVRLHFEPLSVGISPLTPRNRCVSAINREDDVIDIVHQGCNAGSNQLNGIGEEQATILRTSDKPFLWDFIRSNNRREALTTVNINRMGDIINVTVPSTMEAPRLCATSRGICNSVTGSGTPTFHGDEFLDNRNAIPWRRSRSKASGIQGFRAWEEQDLDWSRVRSGSM